MATYELSGSAWAPVRVLRWAAVVGFAELRAIYTWRTWVFGWLIRMLAQVAFFALLATVVGQPDRVQFLVVGNAVMVAALEATVVLTSTADERVNGTLPLLVAAPHSHITVFLGRGVHWLATGLASSTVAFGVSALLFDLVLPWPSVFLVPPLTLLAAASTYTLGTFVAAFAMWAPHLSRILMNMTYMTMMVICGVNVPVTFWPAWVQAVANMLPLTHGLAAVRGVLAGAPWRWVGGQVLAEALVAAGWCLAAIASYRYLADHARRNGAIEFES